MLHSVSITNHTHIEYLASWYNTSRVTKLQEQQQGAGSMHDGAILEGQFFALRTVTEY